VATSVGEDPASGRWVRLFFAVELPGQVRQALGKLRPEAAWARDYRWVEPESMHITLAFLGEQPQEKLEILTQIGAAAARASHPGRLVVGGAGSFGPRKAPRVLWVGLAGDLPKLHHLQAALSEHLQKHGFPVEARPFSPHVTLARRRERAESGVPPLWPPAGPPGLLQAPLEELTLFESQLARTGARYAPLAHFACVGH
jgi:2'-5' RNA ligase